MFLKRFIITVCVIFFLTACAQAVQTSVPPSAVPETTSTPQPKRSTPLPTSTLTPLVLQKIEKFRDNCSQKDIDLPGEGLSPVAYLPSGFCFHGELDMFETGGHVYVAQVAMSMFPSSAEAFRIVDVTDAEHPILVGAWQWNVP